MSLAPLLVSVAFSLLITWVFPKRWRVGLILTGSLLSLYWFQPASPIRNLDYWLTSIAILLTILVWTITQSNPPGGNTQWKSFWTAGAIIGFILLVSLTRYLQPLCCLTPTRPPPLNQVIAFLAIGGSIALLPIFLHSGRKALSSVIIILIISIFIILKSPIILNQVNAWIRSLTGQSTALASPGDLIWFGFSFLAFRLLHILFDYRSGRLQSFTLDENTTYNFFFPALPAGPIDRIERFAADLPKPSTNRIQNTIKGSQRILWGIFKKFVLADSLAIIALNSQNATQINSTLWAWVILFAYSFRIYFDFSGYTDIALGMGNIMGIELPENFNRPYIKQNLTQFWNSWHITLAQWFRSYYFNPTTRFLRSHGKPLPSWVIIFIGQFTTMLLIGLWHGITLNFAIWGAWHGLGLFFHNRWLVWSRPRLANHTPSQNQQRMINFSGWLATFTYVSLGWVWFALPSPESSIQVFKKLVGG